MNIIKNLATKPYIFDPFPFGGYKEKIPNAQSSVKKEKISFTANPYYPIRPNNEIQRQTEKIKDFQKQLISQSTKGNQLNTII